MKNYNDSTSLSLTHKPDTNSHEDISNSVQRVILVEKCASRDSMSHLISINVAKNGHVGCRNDQEICFEDVQNFHYDVDKIHLNISGRVFTTYKRTLERFPQTLLGNATLRSQYFQPHLNQYFLDRHSPSFESILYYYQSRGLKLYRPKDVPIDIFINELEFYMFDPIVILELMQRENIHLLHLNSDKDILPKNQILKKLWLFIEYPSSFYAKLVSLFSSTLIFLSVILAIVETTDKQRNMTNGNSTVNYKFVDAISNPFFIFEAFCNIWFMIEFVLRFISCPYKWRFVRNFLNLIDCFIFLLFTFLIIIMMVNDKNSHQGARSLSILRILKLARVIRIFKLTKYTKLVQVLVLTLRSSIQAIVILILTLLIGVILFAFMIYYAESNADTEFNSLIEGFWYSINVMTTVGDSGLRPKTILGQFVGSVCAVTGILVIAVPIPVITSNFTRFYQVLIENSVSSLSSFSSQNFYKLKHGGSA